MKRTLPVVWLLLVFVLFSFQTVSAQSESPLVLVLKAEGAVTPAMQEYIARGLKLAEQRRADLVILQLNTPGGTIGAMTDIVEDMRASHVPVVVYVAPRGASAGSAGAPITIAAHITAMAPETVIGAASPVDLLGGDLGNTMKDKISSDMKALIRSQAERRGKEASDLAEAMIDDAKAVTSTEALDAGLIDFIAEDVDDLLNQLDGFEVQVAGETRTLHTVNAVTEDVESSFIEQLLAILVNPNIVFLLMTIGVLSIFIELSSPGGWVAGFIGLVCLALAAYGLGVLPVNWFGAVLLVIAFALFILDIKAPTHGALTVAGIGTFIAGALVLFNSPGTPQFQRVSTPLVILTGILTGMGFAVIVGFALRAQKQPVRTGQESLAGATGTAVSTFDPAGQVQAAGELWSAEAVEGSAPICKGDRVEVVEVEGLRLKVKKL